MALLTGNRILLRFNTEVFEGRTSTGISVSNALVEATTKVTGRYAEYIPGVKTSTLDFNKLHTFGEKLDIGDELTFHMGPRDTGWAGQCIIETISIDAPSDEVQTYSGTARVTGELSKFIPIFGEEIFCTTDGREICTTDGRQLYVNVQIN